MALMVGEIMAKIGADKTEFTKVTGQARVEHTAFVNKVNSDKARIEGDAKPFEQAAAKAAVAGKDAGKAIDAAFESARKSVSDDLDRIAKDAEKLGPAGRHAGAEMGEGISGGLADALGSMGGGGVGGLLESFTSAKGAFLTVGLALGALVMDGFQRAAEERRVGGMIAMQTGQATEAAGRLGKLAGDIYANNFGESVEQVGQAITSLFQNEVIDTSASEQAITDLTGRVLTLAQTTGEAAERVTRSSQQLVLNGLAGSFEQAMDMIQHATEIGLNASGELLDTIDEYSVQFQRMGLDGAEAFGLLEQATDAGARNIDVAADAIKEFAILAQDSTSNASRGFRTLGMDAEDALAGVAAGGEPAQEVLRQVLNRLQEMPPSVQRSTAAVDLFGTKAEDLGDALYAMDVDTVTDSFGEFEGAVDQAGKTAGETTPALDKLGRAIGNFATWVGGFAVDAADTMVQGLGEMTGLIDANAAASDDAAGSTEEWGSELWNATDAGETLIQTIDELINQQTAYSNSFVDSAEAQIDYNQAVAEAVEFAKTLTGGLNDTKTAFDLNSEAGQNAQGVINDVVKSGWDMVAMLSADGASAEQLNAVIAQSNQRLYELLVSMGIDAEAARVLADRMFGIPDVDPTVTLVDNASPVIAEVTKKLNGLDGKWINTYVNTIFKTTGKPPANLPPGIGGGVIGDSSGGGGATGAVVEYYAQGGLRPLAPAGSIIGSYRRTGVMRVIGDNPIADEAFIPLQPNNVRSQAILDEVLKRMRPDLAGSAGYGGALGMTPSGGGGTTAGGPSHVDRSITINAVQGVPTVQQLRDVQHEQEVLYEFA